MAGEHCSLIMVKIYSSGSQNSGSLLAEADIKQAFRLFSYAVPLPLEPVLMELPCNIISLYGSIRPQRPFHFR
jgi:hypothetical protein